MTQISNSSDRIGYIKFQVLDDGGGLHILYRNPYQISLWSFSSQLIDLWATTGALSDPLEKILSLSSTLLSTILSVELLSKCSSRLSTEQRGDANRCKLVVRRLREILCDDDRDGNVNLLLYSKLDRSHVLRRTTQGVDLLFKNLLYIC